MDNFLPLAAMAAAALPETDFVSLCSPRFETEDLRVCAVKDTAERKWLVNCPTTEHADKQLLTQTQIMQELSHDGARLPFHLPWPSHTVRIVGGKHALVHPAFPGRPARSEDFTVSDKRPTFSADQIRRRWLSLLDEAAPTQAVPPRLWQRWEERLEDISLWRFASAFIHADLQESYLYIDKETISGITGFGQARFGDPARDLAWVVSSSSDEFAKAVLEQYRKLRLYEDPELNTRIELNSELVLLEWLMHGVHQNSKEIITDARELITQLADTLDSTGLLPALRNDSTQKHHDSREEGATANPGDSSASEPLATREESVAEDEDGIVTDNSVANENA